MALPTNQQGQIAPDTFVPMINNAATTYGVPDAILSGVFGIETNSGQNKNTSSAGAMGLMQFIPSTAARYGYPMTNNPTPAQAQQQFNSAAKYLRDLFGQYGDWNKALEAYSGGGYGLAKVQQAAGQKIQANETASAGFLGTGIDIPNPLNSVAAAITDVFNSAVKDAKYAGVLLVVIGVAAYLMVHGVTGVSARDVAWRAVP